MVNQTFAHPHLPQLPSYTLKPLSPLLPWLSDFHLSLLLPVAAYWCMSLIFWYIDKQDLWSQYRLHTPDEFKSRNRVTKTEVLRSVILQQAIQTALGLLIGYLTSPGDFHGSEEYDIALWAGRVHHARGYIPWILAPIGIDATRLGQNIQTFAMSLNPTVTLDKPVHLLNPLFFSAFSQKSTGGFAAWEIWAAKTSYWVFEPGCRFGIAIFFSDSWQYFWHRAMHSNKWMYRTSPSSPTPLTTPLPHTFHTKTEPYTRQHARPPPQNLRPLRLRCLLQHPLRSLHPRHNRHDTFAHALRIDNQTNNVL